MTARARTAALLLLPLAVACSRGGPPEGEIGSDAGADTGDVGGDTGDTGTPATLVLQGVRGSGTVAGAYSGTETLYFTDVDAEADLCTITSDVAQVELGLPECKGCEFSFAVETSNTAATGCEVDATAYDGVTFAYGYTVDSYGYGVLAYYAAGYGWYVAPYSTASFEGDEFSYDWPVGYFYSYGEL